MNEDIIPIENADVPMSCLFYGVKIAKTTNRVHEIPSFVSDVYP